jgi:hypothetical protein
MSRLSRRRFVTSSLLGGAAALGSPAFLRRALAQPTAGGPKRLLMIFMPNCSVRARWLSQGGRNVDAGTGTATDFMLNTHTMPLTDIRQHITLIHGINMSNMKGDLHSSAQIRVTTGADVVMPNAGGGGGNLPGGPSIDTLVAEQSAVVKAAETKFKQLVLTADSRGISLHHQCVSSDLTNAFIPPQNSPQVLFDRLFKDVNVGAAAGPDRTMALAQLRAKKKSVLDFMTADLKRLEKQISAAQRPMLQSHLAAVAALEKTLETGGGAVPTAGGTLPAIDAGLTPNTSAQHPKLLQAFFDEIRSAFMFDLTRVVSLSFGTGNSNVSFADFMAGPSGGVHNISHQSQNATTMDKLTIITQWYMSRVKEFAQSLAAIPEAGGTMLDNTLIFLFSEVGQWHEHSDIPLLLVGGKNLGHVGGRALRYTRQVNDVGMAILKQLQVPVTGFGDARWFKGPAPELFV